MFDLVVRRVAALVAAPTLFVLSAPALGHGPIVPPRPLAGPPSTAAPTPSAPGPAVAPRTTLSLPAATTVVPRPVTTTVTRRPVTTTVAPRPVTTTVTRRPVTTAVAPRPAANPAQLRARAVMVQVVRLTNETRRDAGCPSLTVDGHLVTASLRQSHYMARTRLFSHVWRDGSTFVDRSEDAGYQQPAGENIAWGYRTAPEVVSAWMASPGHRRNILNCKARSIGAGVAYAADGTPYYTQVFGWR
ncbi:CAP domain-containing protein [Actinoplanes sp. NPDC049802]|uniref:CAP domain-containing protein n=1 Tax=Actinoplanes sp. NPDC049802 TaxID=3154742 RepID=UPI0033EE6597